MNAQDNAGGDFLHGGAGGFDRGGWDNGDDAREFEQRVIWTDSPNGPATSADKSGSGAVALLRHSEESIAAQRAPAGSFKLVEVVGSTGTLRRSELRRVPWDEAFDLPTAGGMSNGTNPQPTDQARDARSPDPATPDVAAPPPPTIQAADSARNTVASTKQQISTRPESATMRKVGPVARLGSTPAGRVLSADEPFRFHVANGVGTSAGSSLSQMAMFDVSRDVDVLMAEGAASQELVI
jgi:hypothetical protein